MRKLFQENKPFLVGYLIVLISVLILKLMYSKEVLFLTVNGNHNSIGDVVFPYVTYLGDGITIILFTLILLFFNYRKAILSLMIYVVSSQITQILKRTVFSEEPRPSKYFEGKASLHFVDGVQIHQMMSFPSGHTTSIFAFMAFLAIITKNKSIGILFLLIACIGAFSRIYLAQHFLEDTIAGSVIGVLSAFMITNILQKYKWYQSPALDKSLLRK